MSRAGESGGARTGLLAIVAGVLVLLHGLPSASAGGSYELLNEVLGGLRIKSSVNIPRIESKLSPGVKAYATIGKQVSCWGFGIEDVSITGSMQEDPVVMDSEEVLQAYLLRAEASNLQFRCEIELCVQVKMLFNLGRDCGKLRIISDARSKTKAVFESLVLSEDFDTMLPTKAVDNGLSCEGMIRMDGIRFEGSSIAKVIGIDVTKFVIDALNGSMKRDTVRQIREAVCEMVVGLTDTINAFAVSNPLVDLVDVDAPVTDPRDAALALERSIAATLEEESSLIDIGDNIVTDLALDVEWDSQLEAHTFRLDPSAGILGQVLEAFNMSHWQKAGSPLLFSVLKELVGIDLETVGERTELLDAVCDALGLDRDAVRETLTFAFAGEAFGRVELELAELSLLRQEALGELDREGLDRFAFLGRQTLGLPPVSLGNLELVGTFRLDADVSTRVVMGELIAFTLEETFQVQVDWDGFVVHLAALLAIEKEAINAMELGGMWQAILDCLMSVFYKTPRFAGFVALADALSLEVGGLRDGISNIAGDLVNAVAPIYQGGLPVALQHYVSKLLVDMELLEPSSCPSADREAEGMDSFQDWSSGVVAAISDLVSADMANDVVDLFVDDNHTVALFREPVVLLRTTLPSFGPDSLSGLELGVANLVLVLPVFKELAFLEVPVEERAQLLHNALVTATPVGVSVDFQIDLLGDDDGASRRELVSTERNNLQLSFSVQSVRVVLDLLLLVTTFDFASIPVEEMLQLDCWIGRLDPGSRLEQIVVDLDAMQIGLECHKCESAILQELSDRLQGDAARTDLLDVLVGLKDSLVGSVENAFDPRTLGQSIVDARARCNNLAFGTAAAVGASVPAGDEDEHSGSTAQSLLIGIAVVLVLALLGSCIAGRVPMRRSTPKVVVASKASTGEPDEVALWRDPSIPALVRAAMPLLLLVNVVLFVIGHVDVVIRIELVGQILRLPFALDDLAAFSIITSTKELWDSGATVLATFLALFSIAWPYVKLLCLGFCWFAPPRWVSPKRRGSALGALDQLGKWSLLELFVLAFILVALSLEITAPDVISFLPRDLYELSLTIVLEYNLYTFTLALLLSLLLANVAVVYSDRIAHRGLLTAPRASGKKAALVEHMVSAGYSRRAVHITRACVVAFVVTAIVLLCVGATSTVLHLEILGLIATVMGISGGDSSNALSLFGFLGDLFETSFAYALVLTVTVFVIPMLQHLLLLVLSVAPVDLHSAIQLQELNKILSAWCALEVFVLGVAVSVLELATVTSGLLSNQCDDIDPFLESLAGLNLVEARHAEAGCFALEANVERGAFIFLALMVLSNAAHIVVTRALDSFIESARTRRPALEFEKGLDLETS